MQSTAPTTAACTAHCPLCHQPNACAMAAGAPAASCWCMSSVIDPAALQRLPPAQRRQACICPHCARPAATIEGVSPPALSKE